MANLKDISTVPELKSLEGTEKVLLNVDGSARQVQVVSIKPKEEWDLDVTVTLVSFDEENGTIWDYDVHYANSYDNILAKIEAGIQPKVRVFYNTMSYTTDVENGPYHTMETATLSNCSYTQEYGGIIFSVFCFNGSFGAFINSDNSIDMWI